MKHILVISVSALVAILAAVGLLNVFDRYFPFGRMWESPAIRPHETVLPVAEEGSVSLNAQDVFYRLRDPSQIALPKMGDRTEAVNTGSQRYAVFCAPCHGPRLDGNGTVGQSFHPLPANLTDPVVQAMSDGALFKTISYGNPPNGRQPPLAATITVEDRWRIIAFIRSFSNRMPAGE